MSRPRQDWYPGLMERTRRFLELHLPKIDLVLEVADARAPRTSRWRGLDALLGERRRLLILNKADLADPGETAAWIGLLAGLGMDALAVSLFPGGRPARDGGILSARGLRSAVERLAASGRAPTGRASKVAVLGIPNVGKSSVLNAVAGRRRAPTGARPGVTRGRQWAVASQHLWLLDLPGVLPPAPRNDAELSILALIGALPEGAYDPLEVARFLLKAMQSRLGVSRAVTVLEIDPQGRDLRGPDALLDAFAARRGLLAPGGAVDALRASQALLAAYRRGGLGPLTLEESHAGPEV